MTTNMDSQLKQNICATKSNYINVIVTAADGYFAMVAVELFSSRLLHLMLARPIFGDVTPHLLQQATGSCIHDSNSNSRDHSVNKKNPENDLNHKKNNLEMLHQNMTARQKFVVLEHFPEGVAIKNHPIKEGLYLCELQQFFTCES